MLFVNAMNGLKRKDIHAAVEATIKTMNGMLTWGNLTGEEIIRLIARIFVQDHMYFFTLRKIHNVLLVQSNDTNSGGDYLLSYSHRRERAYSS